MSTDLVLPRKCGPASAWPNAGLCMAFAWAALFALTFADWREMAHQWWDIDTYSHILLIPPIIAWLVWIRRAELTAVAPKGWWPALIWMLGGLTLWCGGRLFGINLVAQVGVIVAFQGATVAVIGWRAGLVIGFPLVYALFLVPFGDEIIPPLQVITASIAVALTHWSGIAATVDGVNIDTPAGLFIVAEACSGVKFLIAMIALGVLVAWTCFTSWKRRGWFLLACATVPVIANGIRAWATIFVAQYVGAKVAGGFDHIVYGWVFFGLVIALVLGVAWRWFEREPEDAGWTAADIDAWPLARLDRYGIRPGVAAGIVLLVAIAFAVLVRLV